MIRLSKTENNVSGRKTMSLKEKQNLEKNTRNFLSLRQIDAGMPLMLVACVYDLYAQCDNNRGIFVKKNSIDADYVGKKNSGNCRAMTEIIECLSNLLFLLYDQYVHSLCLHLLCFSLTSTVRSIGCFLKRFSIKVKKICKKE